MDQTIDLSVVMIYIGNLDKTENAIVSLRETIPTDIKAEILLFRNGPPEDGISATIPFEQHSRENLAIHHMVLPRNAGIIAVRHLGCRLARSTSRYILVCDNDVVFGSGWYEMCVNATTEGYDIIGHDGCFIDFNEGKRWFNFFITANPKDDKVHEVDSVTGYFQFFKTDVYKAGAQYDSYWVDRVGFDDIEAYGGTLEDTEFCMQARASGKKIGVLNVPVFHHSGTSKVKGAEKNRVLRNTVEELFVKRWISTHKTCRRKEDETPKHPGLCVPISWNQ